MENETQPEEVQDGIAMSNDELAAAMGFMTTLGEQQMMAEQEQQVEQGEEIAQEEQAIETETPDPTESIESLKTEVMGELETIREEIKKSKEGDDEIEALKKEIEEVLNEETNEEER